MRTILGLTGPTGSGKSTAAKLALQKGIQVIDCDKVAREAVEKGSKGLEALTNTFGKEILNDDGSLNRKKLAAVAFKDNAGTKLLNETILPFIVELVKLKINSQKVLLDAPTLFESKLDKICNYTFAILADDSVRLNRIKERDNINENDALLRMNAGKNDDFYKNCANYVVYNNGDLKDFILKVDVVLDNVFGG